jgi:glycosyltransferase involved in cell wall biosynthesis
VLSVAALNRGHKRIDYVIEEVARLPEPRPYLLLVGQPEPDTPGLRALAHSLLGQDGHSIRTVPAAEVSSLYRASDVLVLASLGEAFGRVLIEAMAEGVPCVAHDYAVTRYVLGDHGQLGNLSRPGGLAELLGSVSAPVPDEAERRHRFAYEHFSWDRLRPAYVAFLRAAAGLANNTVSSSSGDAVWTKQR